MNFIKTHILNILGCVALISILSSCDNIKEDDRYILGEEITVERSVLLEDFTGQYCVNCPEAHEVIKQLEEQYGKDKVIAVSIHCGDFGIPTSSTNFSRGAVGLMTAEGEAIMEAYGINSFPMGVIDNGKPETFDAWPTSVRSALQKPTDVTIDVSADYVASPNNGTEGYFGTIVINANVTSGSTREAQVQFWIVEDEITAYQKSETGSIADYVHDNVFRAQVFDGLNGNKYNFESHNTLLISGSIESRWTDKERWELKNLSVVAYVSDKNGVLQVKRVKVNI